jgi:hypothetical protein
MHAKRSRGSVSGGGTSRELSTAHRRAERSALALAMKLSPSDPFSPCHGHTAMSQMPSECPLRCLLTDHSTLSACGRKARVKATDELRTRPTAVDTSRCPRCRILSRIRCFCTTPPSAPRAPPAAPGSPTAMAAGCRCRRVRAGPEVVIPGALAIADASAGVSALLVGPVPVPARMGLRLCDGGRVRADPSPLCASADSRRLVARLIVAFAAPPGPAPSRKAHEFFELASSGGEVNATATCGRVTACYRRVTACYAVPRACYGRLTACSGVLQRVRVVLRTCYRRIAARYGRVTAHCGRATACYGE